jgi:hypothetical protein
MVPFHSPDKYGNINENCAMPSMARDLMASFSDPSSIMCPGSEELMENQGILDYVHFTTYNGPFSSTLESMQGTPTLEMDLPTPSSIASSMHEDFVIPSQTTFMDTLSMQSPIRSSKLHFNLQYSPALEFDANFTFGNSPQGMKYFGSPQNESKLSLLSSIRSSPLRQLRGEPLVTSFALHRAQSQYSPIKQGSQSSKTNKLKIKRCREARGSRREAKACVIEHEEKATKLCVWPGCKSKFRRSEHLKRHERTHTNSEFYDCPFCFKPFGRSDNLKSHIKLHTQQGKKSSRTEYFEDALPFWESLNKRSRKTDEASVTDETEDAKMSRAEGY